MLEGIRVDTGTPDGYREAVRLFGNIDFKAQQQEEEVEFQSVVGSISTSTQTVPF